VALVVWGTVYQAEHGLYQAQQKFFYSWFFFLLGFIPFPGTVMILFILFVNLVCVLFFRVGFKLANLGNIITHLGIIILLAGGFFSFYFSEESSLMLKEGESSNMSSSRHLWELAAWELKSGDKDVYAVDTAGFSSGKTVRFDDLKLELAVKEYYKNCSASGTGVLKDKPLAAEASENIAGGVFEITPYPGMNTGGKQEALLYGQDSRPAMITVDGRRLSFTLRRKKIALPLYLFLKDFRVKLYPNSTIPKSYESTVTINAEGGVARDVVISMNKPLRFEDYTFFQSSYHVARDGTEYTILAVVKNAGRLIPYIASITIFLGLVIHFLVMLFRRRRNKNKP
jgi:hypothetical protein